MRFFLRHRGITWHFVFLLLVVLGREILLPSRSDARCRFSPSPFPAADVVYVTAVKAIRAGAICPLMDRAVHLEGVHLLPRSFVPLTPSTVRNGRGS